MQRNRLAAEMSPYLLQHAQNPVDWYPWGEEALERARREDKPILLSIGYSACHWCHVMAHESFEDTHIAALMNRRFVNIKVDREERPDLDKIYQMSQQLITQRNGGWPLTMFLAPDDLQAFFGGTYFPKEARHGTPGFAAVLTRVAEYFGSHRAQIRMQNAELARTFSELEGGGTASSGFVLDDSPLRHARSALEQAFDAHHGGFGRAPKFPHPSSIERCLRHWHGTAHGMEPDLKALFMATLTLTRMAEGGIFDQLGGGFHRYSVDDSWMVPHFEKMLYDNAQLLQLYAGAALATGEPLFHRVALETADWLLRDMHAPAGGFCSSIDADSQGHEGMFYVWHRDEVRELLPADEYHVVAGVYGLDRPPNFEGRWHLYVAAALQNVRANRNVNAEHSVDEVSARQVLDAGRRRLLDARNHRPWPTRDDKVLTSWNALTIKGLAAAGRALNRPELTAAASATVDYLEENLWRGGRLLAACRDGRAHLPAYLDDYAFLVDALLELLQSRWRSSDLNFALELIETMLARFPDIDGGFFFTAADHEPLIHRSKSFADDALPSGNGVAASVLCRLGYLLGEPRYLTAAERTLKAAWPLLIDHGRSHMTLLNALQEFLAPPQILIIRGADAAQEWAARIRTLYAPQRMTFVIPEDAAELPSALATKPMRGGVTAYLCTGMTCSAPLTNLDELARNLASRINA